MSDIKQLAAKYEEEVTAAKKLQADLQTMQNNRQQIATQLRENELVLKELEFLETEEDAKVFKLIGPALIPQESHEAVHNVKKRIEFIKEQLRSSEEKFNDLQTQFRAKGASVQKLQSVIQGLQSGAAAKGPETTG